MKDHISCFYKAGLHDKTCRPDLSVRCDCNWGSNLICESAADLAIGPLVLVPTVTIILETRF